MNLGRARAAHDIAWASALENKCDILRISEPNKKIAKQKNWITDERGDVAVVLNKTIEASEIKINEGRIVVKVNDIYHEYCLE